MWHDLTVLRLGAEIESLFSKSSYSSKYSVRILIPARFILKTARSLLNLRLYMRSHINRAGIICVRCIFSFCRSHKLQSEPVYSQMHKM